MSEQTIASPRASRRLSWLGLQGLCDFAATVAFDLRADGVDHVPRTGGVLLLANHQSFLDPVLVALRLEREIAFLARSTLFQGAFGAFIQYLNAFPVKQGKGDVGAMKQTIELLKHGHAVVVFPEGARTFDGHVQPLAPGVALLIQRAKVPVVPIAIEGAFDAWPRTRKLPQPARIRVAYGRAIAPGEVDAREVVGRVEASIRSLLHTIHQREEGPWTHRPTA
jgi:1-acyl-sn-glycerol-3-phosphate acyltransferase